MRIAFVVDDAYPGFGGQARATEGHVRVLAESGHDVRVLAGREATPSEPPPGVVVERLPTYRPGNLQAHFALPSWSATERLVRWADIVQVNAPTPLGALAITRARAGGTPCVLGVHTQIESATTLLPRSATLVHVGLTTWYRLLYRLPDALTAPTAFAARMARARTPRPVIVVSNGVTLPVDGECDPSEVGRVRRALGRTFLVAYVGRLSAEKDPEAIVDLAARTPDDIAWVIAGNGPSLDAVRRRCETLGVSDRVHVLGFVDEAQKHALLWAADAFVMPSPTELQSIATLEAMARGCAIVAAGHPTSAVPDLVRETGCGIVYPPGRPGDAAREIDSLLRDTARLASMRERALAGASHHDMHRAGTALEGLYASLLRVFGHRR